MLNRDELPKIKMALDSALTEVFETMAFADVETSSEVQWMQCSHTVAIDVLSPFKARLSLALHSGVLKDLTAAALGQEVDECSAADMKDALCEFLNTIAGKFVNDYFNELKDFTLGLPAEDGHQPSHFLVELKYMVNGQPVCVGISEI